MLEKSSYILRQSCQRFSFCLKLRISFLENLNLKRHLEPVEALFSLCLSVAFSVVDCLVEPFVFQVVLFVSQVGLAVQGSDSHFVAVVSVDDRVAILAAVALLSVE